MPLPGGATDKIGNRYESQWTVRNLFRVLSEEVSSIYLEPPGPEGKGIEFFVQLSDGTKEYHQVKRQRKEPWTISSLLIVLENFKDKLQKNNSRCVFVSSTSADTLRELTSRASDASDFNDFQSNFVSSQDWKEEFKDFCKKLNFTSQEAYNALKRIEVVTIDEKTLAQDNNYRFKTIIDGNEENIADILMVFALKSIHKELYADYIWSHLTNNGFNRRSWSRDPRVSEAINAVNQRYLNSIESSMILGKPRPRSESKFILEKLKNNNSRKIIFVTGPAGVGKSNVLTEILRYSQLENIPYIALRMDRVEPVTTEQQLGAQIGLPDSIVNTLTNFSIGRKCFIVIDQLDAVSLTSGRNTKLFDRISEVLIQCEPHVNVNIILSCRKFDLMNDIRFQNIERKFSTEEIIINNFSLDIVNKILSENKLDVTNFTEKQLNFLSVPLHLNLFIDIVSKLDESRKNKFRFSNLNELYAEYLEYKINSIKEKLDKDFQWTKLIDKILHQAMENQSLFVTQNHFMDDFSGEIKALISEGILVREEKKIAFFHETFFDYLFARRFFSQEKSLLLFLQQREQHLFFRATVRQILNYQRQDDFENYIKSIKEIILSSEIRFHLKKIIFDWLSDLSEPHQKEWEVLQEAMSLPNQDMAEQVWAVTMKAAWLQLLDSIGYLQKELDSGSEESINRIITHFIKNTGAVPINVRKIILSFPKRPAPYPEYAKKLFLNSNIFPQAWFIELYRNLLENNLFPVEVNPFFTFPEIESSAFYFLPDINPELALDAFEVWLSAFIECFEKKGIANPFGGQLNYQSDVLEKMARFSPNRFLLKTIPVISNLANKNAIKTGNKPWKDSIWNIPERDSLVGLPNQLLKSTILALQLLTKDNFQDFISFIDHLKLYLDFETPRFLIAQGYLANGDKFANEVVDLFVSDKNWLRLGWKGEPYSVSRQLIQEISPYCSEEKYQILESVILNYYDNDEIRSPKKRGAGQLILLSGFIENRRSKALEKCIYKLSQKFAIEINQLSVNKMDIKWNHFKDKHWTKAITYDSIKINEETLCRKLIEETKKNPTRFAKLFLKIKNNSLLVFFDSILNGLLDSENIEPNLIWDIIRYCHSINETPFGWFIGQFAINYSENDIPEDILKIIAFYVSDPNPKEEYWQSQERIKRLKYNRNPELEGTISVRGKIAFAIGVLIDKNKKYLAYISQYLEILINDSSVSVRTQVIYILLAVIKLDRSYAIKLFLQLCQEQNEILLCGDYALGFMQDSYNTNSKDIKKLIEKMVNSSSKYANYKGALLATNLALLDKPLRNWIEILIFSSSESVKTGIAEVASISLKTKDNGDWCKKIILHFFNDDSIKVRQTASFFLKTLKEEDAENLRDIFEKFIQSKCIEDEACYFYKALTHSRIKMPKEIGIDSKAIGGDGPLFFKFLDANYMKIPELVCAAFERKTEVIQNLPADEKEESKRIIDRTNETIFKLYESTTSKEIKTRCLNIIDLLSKHTPRSLTQIIPDRNMI
jgi:hypothetical protein